MMQSRLLVALATIFIASGCSFTQREETDDPAAVSQYQRGKQDLADGNYGLALAHFSAAVERNPENIAALNGLGITYAKLDLDDAAKSAFERALTLDRTSALTRSNYAIFLEKLGERSPTAGPLAKIDPPKDPPRPKPVAAPAEIPTAPRSNIAFTISNGSGQSRLARRLQQYLSGRGFPADRTANATRFDHAQSVLFCHSQSRDAAEEIRRVLPAAVKLVVLVSKANTVELVAGTDLNDFDAKLALASPAKGAMR